MEWDWVQAARTQQSALRITALFALPDAAP